MKNVRITIIGLLLLISLTACSQAAPATQAKDTVGQTIATSAVPAATPSPAAMLSATQEVAGLATSSLGDKQYQHCYATAANKDWVVFMPHPDEDKVVFALQYTDISAKPIKVLDDNVKSLSETIAADGSLLVITQGMFAGQFPYRMTVYDLLEKKVVATYDLTLQPYVDWVDVDEIIFLLYDGEENVPGQRVINPPGWDHVFVPESPVAIPAKSVSIEVTKIQQRLSAAASWCKQFHTASIEKKSEQ